MKAIVTPFVVLGATFCCGGAGDVDLAKIDRHIGRQPAYAAEQPLYCLAVFGRDAGTRVWLVLDKSAADAEHYDVLYADLNTNGDLTDADERITAKPNPYGQVHFKLPDFTDPRTGDRHTDFKLNVSDGDGARHLISSAAEACSTTARFGSPAMHDLAKPSFAFNCHPSPSSDLP